MTYTQKERLEQERLRLYGPPPVNPFKEARESIIDPATKRSISHHELAKKIRVTKLSLIRLEQGTFTEPLPKVMEYLVSIGFNELSLVDGYINYQYHMRARHAQYFGPNLEFDISSATHPFSQLRSSANNGTGVNPTECAKDLCLPQATICYFEQKYRQQKSVPKAIINVMPDLGYSDAQITSFLGSYKDWRSRRTGSNVFSLPTSLNETGDPEAKTSILARFPDGGGNQ